MSSISSVFLVASDYPNPKKISFVTTDGHKIEVTGTQQLFNEGRFFTPRSYEGGRLFYNREIPILSIETTNFFKAGETHGYLLAESILKIVQRIPFVAKHHLPKLEKIKKCIPKKYFEEIKGIKRGVHKWEKEHDKKEESDLIHKLFLLNLCPEKQIYTNGNGNGFCTTILGHDEKKGIILARNVDWDISFGKESLAIRRNQGHNKRSIEFTGPGAVGVISGMNNFIVLAANTCPHGGLRDEGIPSVFFNRKVLDHASSVKKVKEMVGSTNFLCSYHLIVADKNSGSSFHILQGDDKKSTLVRDWKVGNHLVTTNAFFCSNFQEKGHANQSQERGEILTQFFAKNNYLPAEERLRKSLSLQYVNGSNTNHTMMLIPGALEAKIAFSALFSARKDLQKMSL